MLMFFDKREAGSAANLKVDVAVSSQLKFFIIVIRMSSRRLVHV